MIHLLFSPLTWALLLAALLWLTWHRLGRWSRIAGLGLGGVLLLACTPLGANALMRTAESPPAASGCDAGGARPAPMVVLSGGFDRVPHAVDDYAALSPASWRRLRGAVERWHDDDRRSAMVIAGGGPYAIKESAVLARLARDWGVPATALRAETRSTTTWDSAIALRPTLPPRIRLVSSAMHLPRAWVAFRAAGFQACVQASDSSYVAPGGWGYFVPQLSAMVKSQAALYELVGTVFYRIRARKSPARPDA